MFDFVLDLSVLPSQAPQLLLTAPPASTPVFIAIAIAFSLIFLIIFVLTSFRHKFGEKMSAALERPFIHRAAGWIGFFGFFIGIFYCSSDFHLSHCRLCQVSHPF